MTQGPHRRWERAALWVLPMALMATLLAMRQASLPFWQAFNLDPDYYYLLNGLRIVEGLSPTDVSHPGTPIQVLIALVIRALHPFAAATDVVDAVLADPEGHLVAVTWAIYPLASLSLWLLGREAWRWGGLAPALLAQSSPFLIRIIAKMALHPKPEPFMVIAAALLCAVAFAILRHGKAEDRHAWAAGAAVALGVVCKIHFVALGVLPLLLLDRRRLAIYGASCALFTLLFFAPALGSFDIWVDWMRRVSLGAGAYGEGPRTVINPTTYFRAIWKLFSGKWFYTIAFGVALIVIGMQARRGRLRLDLRLRLLAGLVAAELATHILIAKQPAPHYMIPALMLTGPTMALLWSISRDMLPPVWWRRGWVALGLVVALSSLNTVVRQRGELARWSRDTQALPMERFAACAKVYFDAASAKSFAFQRGDMNAQARYSPRLDKLFPADEYTWFIFNHTWWPQGMMRWNRPVELEQVMADYPCTVFRGNQAQRLRDLTPHLAMDDSCEVGEETLFTRGITCAGERVRR